MGVFVIMYVIMFITWGGSDVFPKKNRSMIICVICGLILWLIQSFRGFSVGTDLIVYIPFFENIAYREYTSNDIEIGYFFFNKIIYNRISEDPSVFLSIVSATLLIPITIIIKRYSKNPALSFIIFASFVVYIFSFSALRQTIAIGFTTLSYIFVEKKKILPFLGLVILATLFHTTAIIFIIVYPLCNWVTMTWKKYLICFCIGGGLLFSLKTVINFILPILFSEKQEHYMGYYSDEVTPAYNLAILIFLFFLATFFVKRPTKTDLNMRMIIFIAFWCQCLGLISPVASRIGFYFFAFIGVLLANIGYEFSIHSQDRNLASIAMALLMVWFFFSRYTNGYLEVIPYKFVWE